MPQIVWDQEIDRTFESGLDRGVLFPPTGPGVPWNGLVSVVEKFDKNTSPIYFDGMKVNDIVLFGDFAAALSAVTYPDEFEALEGSDLLRAGVKFQDQPPQTFGLCYRTCYGNDAADDATGYKLHILYNVTAIPADKSYGTMSNQPSLMEFVWNLTAVPEEISGFRPTAHVVLDSTKIDPILLQELESQLYGTTADDPVLMSMSDLFSFMQSFYRIKVTDHGDGTWSIDINDDVVADLLTWLDGTAEGTFQVAGANAIFHVDETEYDLSDTIDASDIAEIKIVYNVDGSWTATADSDALIIAPGDGTFTIVNADAIFLDDETYRISDTQLGS